MNKAILVIAAFFLLIASAGAQTIVTDTFEGSHDFDLTQLTINSCHVKENYEAGSCQYVYACYAVLPMGATSIDHAFQRECKEVTGQTTASVSFTFSPPKGYRLAVVYFATVLDYSYVAEVWSSVVSIELKTAEEIVSLCPAGKMLRGTFCYDAQAFCVNSLGTNMCDNPYQLYMLDTGTGFNPTDYASMCADRNPQDFICDETVSLFCSDINDNGICDDTEVQISTNACIDSQKNWVCDDVETVGTFCRVYYDPVCNPVTNVTYPNSCFADAAGIVGYVAGECVPIEIEIQCRADADCYTPCEGVATSCNNFQCEYFGECNPSIIQCSVDSDCPPSPCIGVLAECNPSINTCNYIGRCVEQPQKPGSIWAEIAKVFWDLWLWILGFIGW